LWLSLYNDADFLFYFKSLQPPPRRLVAGRRQGALPLLCAFEAPPA